MGQSEPFIDGRWPTMIQKGTEEVLSHSKRFEAANYCETLHKQGF